MNPALKVQGFNRQGYSSSNNREIVHMVNVTRRPFEANLKLLKTEFRVT